MWEFIGILVVVAIGVFIFSAFRKSFIEQKREATEQENAKRRASNLKAQAKQVSSTLSTNLKGASSGKVSLDRCEALEEVCRQMADLMIRHESLTAQVGIRAEELMKVTRNFGEISEPGALNAGNLEQWIAKYSLRLQNLSEQQRLEWVDEQIIKEPDQAMLYLFRMMLRTGCRTAAQLAQAEIDLRQDSDFYNFKRFGNAEQRQLAERMYESYQQKEKNARVAKLKEVCAELVQTGILELAPLMQKIKEEQVEELISVCMSTADQAAVLQDAGAYRQRARTSQLSVVENVIREMKEYSDQLSKKELLYKGDARPFEAGLVACRKCADQALKELSQASAADGDREREKKNMEMLVDSLQAAMEAVEAIDLQAQRVIDQYDRLNDLFEMSELV